jgi:hypothetical protein
LNGPKPKIGDHAGYSWRCIYTRTAYSKSP